jgi:ABC-2 type transport system ATP-binding protein
MALNDVSFNVYKGEIFGYLGPNGSGKTTTIRILTTLIQSTSGKVKVFGYNAQEKPLEVRKKIGLVMQQFSFEPYLKVAENMWLYGYLRGLPRQEAKSKSKELLEIFGLTEHANKKAVELSLGLKRRLQIAREFIYSPSLLFLDEPTISLDPEARRLTLDLIRKRAKEMTVFFTTQNMSEAEYLCNRITILNSGQIIASGTPENLKAETRKKNLEDAYFELIRRIKGIGPASNL